MKNPNAPIQFRYAQPQDADALAEVYCKAVENSNGIPDSITSTEKLISGKAKYLTKKMKQDDDYQVLVALKENAIVGFVGYTKTEPKKVHIDNFYALDKTGSALHKKIIMAENADTIFLSATNSAKSAYETWGYTNTVCDEMVLDGLRIAAWKNCMAKNYPRFPVMPADFFAPV